MYFSFLVWAKDSWCALLAVSWNQLESLSWMKQLLQLTYTLMNSFKQPSVKSSKAQPYWPLPIASTLSWTMTGTRIFGHVWIFYNSWHLLDCFSWQTSIGLETKFTQIWKYTYVNLASYHIACGQKTVIHTSRCRERNVVLCCSNSDIIGETISMAKKLYIVWYWSSPILILYTKCFWCYFA